MFRLAGFYWRALSMRLCSACSQVNEELTRAQDLLASIDSPALIQEAVRQPRHVETVESVWREVG